MRAFFAAVQKLGRSLMLPIAVLPVAGLLLRLGQPDLLDLHYVAAAGNAVFANLGLLFAIGVAVGLARGNNGAAGLAAVVAYFVTTEGARVLIPVPPAELAEATGRFADLLGAAYKDAAVAKMSVPVGLSCGIMSGMFYNRFADIRLPNYLAFFAGKRFVPIVSGFGAFGLAAAFGFGWPGLEAGMNALSEGVVAAGGGGLFVYGVLNRLLIITGLHHILNNIAWFIVGDFEGVTGDLRRFFAGDPQAGAFMTGFFPVMMFGLPAACLAMYRAAEPSRRKAMGGLLLSMGITSFLTGITEPIEFTFMFVAPVLYAIHAVLTGISMSLLDFLQVRHGFGFSAGLFDYVLNYNRATKPLVILVVGAGWFALYYVIFHWAIVRFDIPTPGRGPVEGEAAQGAAPDSMAAGAAGASAGRACAETAGLLAALGGAENLVDIDACTTRLRLRIVSQDSVDEAALKRFGAAGVLRPTPDALQVIMGLRADEIAGNLRDAISGQIGQPKGAGSTSQESSLDLAAASSGGGRVAESGSAGASEEEHDEDFDEARRQSLLDALGGAGNLGAVEVLGTRLGLEIRDAGQVDEAALRSIGVRGVAWTGKTDVQLLFDRQVKVLADLA